MRCLFSFKKLRIVGIVDKEKLSQKLNNSLPQIKPLDLIVFFDFSESEFELNHHFSALDHAGNKTKISCNLTFIIDGHCKPFTLISKGWRGIAVLSFSGEIPLELYSIPQRVTNSGPPDNNTWIF